MISRLLREALAEALHRSGRRMTSPRDILTTGAGALSAGGMTLGYGVTDMDARRNPELDPLPQHYARNMLYGAGAGVLAPFMLASALSSNRPDRGLARARNMAEQIYNAMGDYRRPGYDYPTTEDGVRAQRQRMRGR